MKQESHIFPVMLYILQHSFIFKKYITIPHINCFHHTFQHTFIICINKQNIQLLFFCFFFMSVLQFSCLRHFKCFIHFYLYLSSIPVNCFFCCFFLTELYSDITNFLYKHRSFFLLSTIISQSFYTSCIILLVCTFQVY